jgi:hypothetical protein
MGSSPRPHPAAAPLESHPDERSRHGELDTYPTEPAGCGAPRAGSRTTAAACPEPAPSGEAAPDPTAAGSRQAAQPTAAGSHEAARPAAAEAGGPPADPPARSGSPAGQGPAETTSPLTREWAGRAKGWCAEGASLCTERRAAPARGKTSAEPGLFMKLRRGSDNGLPGFDMRRDAARGQRGTLQTSAASRLRGLAGEPRAYSLDMLRLDGEPTETDRPLAAELHE